MSNILYPKGKEAILSGLVDLTSAVIKVVLVGAGYTYSAAHDHLDDISGGERLKISAQLTGITIVAGVFKASDTLFTSVTAGATGTYVVGFIDTGTPSTSTLLWIDDTGTNIPIPTNGGDIACAFNASGIFAI